MKKVILILFLGIFTAGSVVGAEAKKSLPVSASRWLWFETPAITPDTDCYYRSSLKVAGNVKSIELICYFDDSGELFLNGKRIGRNRSFQQKKMPLPAQHFLISSQMLKNENVLAVHVKNYKYSGGFFMLGKKILADGSVEFFHSTPSAWKASSKVPDGWKLNSFDDSKWQAAKDFGDVLTAPWNTVTDIITLGMTPSEKIQYEKRTEK